MSDRENPNTQDIHASTARRKTLIKQFVAYEFEHETGKQVAKIKKKLESQLNASGSAQLDNVVVDCDEVYVQGTRFSVGSIIKTKAVSLYPQYQSLTTDNKAIVSLGLNSILDTSFTYPNSQAVLFTSQQWDELRKRYKPKKYDTSEYAHIKPILEPIFKAYKGKNTTDTNWINMYKQVRSLEKIHDQELNADNNDISFCIYFMLQVLLLIKHQPCLFDSQIDSSEWDYIVKFWGLITERLFYGSHLRLKWGDTCLTMHDTIPDASFKVDLRILNDKIKQRYNTENDIAVVEVAEQDPGNTKFVSDRCKLSIENKVIIDRYLMDGVNITSVDSLQISGLEVFYLNTSLEEHGLYVTTKFHNHSITKSLKDLVKYMDLALKLLCFRDTCITTSNTYDNHLIHQQEKKKSGKRSVDDLQDDELISKQEAIRGTWNPPRTAKTLSPAVPKNLWKMKSSSQ